MQIINPLNPPAKGDMSFGIQISSGKTGQGGTNAGWRQIKEISAWICQCGRKNAKHWNLCPDCHARRP